MRSRTSRFRRGRTGAALVAAAAATTVAATLVAGCGSSVEGGTLADQVNPIDLSGQTYTVGGKSSPEHEVLCEMAVAALQSVGAEVEQRCNLGDAQAARDALVRGEIDMYWENTGIAWVSFHGQQPVRGASPQYRAVEERDLAENAIVWLEGTWYNPTTAFAVREESAEQLGLTSLSDMAGYFRAGQPGNLCVEAGYQQRPEGGLAGLQQTYEFQLPSEQQRVLPGEAIYQATAEGRECLFGQVTAGERRLPQLGLRMLRDDRRYHPPFNAAVTIRQDVYQRNEDIKRVFTPIARKLTDEVMAGLTQRMSEDGASAREVARLWLSQRGYIGDDS